MRGFYGVVNLAPGDESADRGRVLASQLLAGGASVLQVRMKGAPAVDLFAVASAVHELTVRHRVPLIVNDRLDVALAVGAEGVHLGQDDLPLEAALRAMAALDRRIVVGISTHTLAQARAAVRAGADYLGFGPIYPTISKPHPDPVVGPQGLAEAVRAVAPVPVAAIGGITCDRVPHLLAAGAVAVCVMSAVNSSPDVTASARAVADCWTETDPS